MKKIKSFIVLLVLVLGLAACGSSVTIGSFSSKYFNGEDYDNAVQTVMDHLNGIKGCNLSAINYAGDKVVKAEADARGTACELVMVLTADFTTDEETDSTDFEANQTYKDYKWVLTRTTSSSIIWEIQDSGSN